MDNMVTLIMLACCYPILPIIALVLANETKPKKNIMIGVTLPKERQEEPEVKAICTGYRKNMRNWSVFLTLVLIPVFFVPSFSIMLTIWLCWLLLAMIVPIGVYIRAHLKMKALKVANEWFGGVAKCTVVDITVTAALKKPLSHWLFLPALIIGLLPLVIAYFIDQDLFYAATMTLSCVSIIVLSIFIYPLIFRQKADVVDDDALVNLALTGARRYQWGKCWILLSYLTAFFSLALWFGRNSEWGVLCIVSLYSLAAIAICIRTEMNARKTQEKLTAQYGQKQYVDEDDFWLWGLFYYNPDDRHFMINKRVGIGTTVNLARPMAKVWTVLTIFVLACLPMVGVWTIYEEYTPITVTAGETSVSVKHLGFEISVDYDDINDADLLYALPGLSRLNGTGMETIDKGKFSVEGYGVCQICIDPGADAFLVMETDKKTYMISTPSPAETEQIYQWIEDR